MKPWANADSINLLAELLASDHPGAPLLMARMREDYGLRPVRLARSRARAIKAQWAKPRRSLVPAYPWSALPWRGVADLPLPYVLPIRNAAIAAAYPRHTLDQIGREWGITRERVRQIVAKTRTA